MSLSDFVAKLREKKSFIEGSQTNIPITGSNQSLAEVFDRFLDPGNCRQLSNISLRERPYAAITDAYSYARDEFDVDGFLRGLTMNMFILSSSNEGERSKQLQNIAVGQMNRDFAVELANIRSGSGENKELKDVI